MYVASRWSTTTRRMLPWQVIANDSRSSRSGSRGANDSCPSWSRMPAEAGDQREPGAGQRRDVHAVAGVVLQVVQVHQRGLAAGSRAPARGGPTSAAITAWVHADSDESRTVRALVVGEVARLLARR